MTKYLRGGHGILFGTAVKKFVIKEEQARGITHVVDMEQYFQSQMEEQEAERVLLEC